MRKKRKPAHLNSESSDEESEPEVNLNKKKKIFKKYLNNSNTLKKTLDKSTTSMKNLPSPPVPPVFSERFIISFNKITRQHIPQCSKQPSFSISIAKDSDKNRANLVEKITSQNNQENKENKRQLFIKLKPVEQNKQQVEKQKKYN